ncbi:MAG TPA: NUDIX hydrolase [Actinopolymorphaceae bacterium]
MNESSTGHQSVPGGKPEAIVALVRREDRFLIIQRAPNVSSGGYWAPLSGRIEPGESQQEALVREIREEIGVGSTPEAKVWECETDDGRYLLHWWAAELHDTDLRLDPAEVSDAKWVTADEFLMIERTFEGDRRFFERHRTGRDAEPR